MNKEWLQELMPHLAKIPPEELVALYSSTFLEFSEVREQLRKGDPAAFETTEALKEKLKAKMTALFSDAGIDLNKILKKVTNYKQEQGLIV